MKTEGNGMITTEGKTAPPYATYSHLTSCLLLGKLLFFASLPNPFPPQKKDFVEDRVASLCEKALNV